VSLEEFVTDCATTHVVALSGGKDSTALALKLAEVEPRPYVYLITPTGDELPEMVEHWASLERRLGQPMLRITNRTLADWIDEYSALPNWRQRWCTRLLKIEPCLAFLAKSAPAVLYVGLRADEEERKGIYSETVTCRFPLREWGWGLGDVRGYLREQGVKIPRRTDCARCYGQRLSEWWNLLHMHPELYASAEADEARTGHTYRSPSRDTWPAGLKELREAFSTRHPPRGATLQRSLFDDDDEPAACRVCKL